MNKGGKIMVSIQEQQLAEQAEQYEDTQKDQYLIFTIGTEHYGIEIRIVTEIINMQKTTPVPETQDYIRGIINLRGRIIPVMDVRLRFKKEMIEYNDRTCIIVVDLEDISIGLIVDSVSEVLSITEDMISPPPEFANFSNRYIKGIGKVENDVKLILDCNKLLNDDDKSAAYNIINK